jgi:hypothetical protein
VENNQLKKRDGRIILNWILEKQILRMQTEIEAAEVYVQ